MLFAMRVEGSIEMRVYELSNADTVCLQSILVYGNETWAIKVGDKQRITKNTGDDSYKCKKLFSLKHGVRASLITLIKKQISKLNPQTLS